MEDRVKNAIMDIENHIKWEQEFIDKCSENIKKYTETCTAEDMAMFLPGKIKELEDAINRRKKYAEQLSILQFIQREN